LSYVGKKIYITGHLRWQSGMSGIVIGKKTNGTGRDGTGLNGIERDGVKL